jgi:hypothetical protein
METQAWRRHGFRYPRHVPTMLCPEELQYLCWLTERLWTGEGYVVEIGPWLGGSTVCLAAGMVRSGHDASGRLVAIDNFLWRDFMSARAALPLRPGESFRSFFESHLSDYASVVEARTLALPDELIPGDGEARRSRFDPAEGVPLLEGPPCAPIEILFIDGAKSWRGMRHLLRELSGAFVPGRTLVVCQDFKYWGAYWVPLLMSRLAEHAEPVHDVLSGTTLALRLARAVPPALLDALEADAAELDVTDTLRALERTAARLEADGDRAGALHVRLGQARFLAQRGEPAAAERALLDTQAAWDSPVPTEQLRRAHHYLRAEHGRSPAYPARFKVRDVMRRVRGLARAVLGGRAGDEPP